MPAEPLTFLLSRRVDAAHHDEFLRWMRTGEALAATRPGFLGAGLFSPPAGGDAWQIVFRFADEASLAAWLHDPERGAWLAGGTHLVQASEAQCARGLDGWFAAPPPRWKQTIAVWLAFFPVSLALNGVLGDWLSQFPLLWRVLISTLMLTPLMVGVVIPFVSRKLRRWLAPPLPASLAGR
ncbi:antibiotic biosynthesis monooxygenase [Crenobacter intestini]|uniref:Antibiotic biosynthesis monooxygenase n=1 Tax=Crenobacter intestini TaxID=2563443 RepID=A0A4T0UP49_9NEIS|nr:antibiotic biosynthesis monooxygenase [Crenobacter intestini]TIC80550.1 antibiotic biosynthesis monooxygenase [Crenobacter intestini]